MDPFRPKVEEVPCAHCHYFFKYDTLFHFDSWDKVKEQYVRVYFCSTHHFKLWCDWKKAFTGESPYKKRVEGF